MKKVLNSAFSRAVIVGIFMLIQAAILVVMLLLFQEYWVYFYAVCFAITMLAVLHIINSNSNPAYKIAWILPIMFFPIFGGLFYLVFGKDRLSRHELKKMSEIEEKYNASMKITAHSLSALKEESKEAALQASYIYNVSDAPPYSHTSTEFLPIGETMFERMMQELEKAEKFIFMEYFIINEGTMWDSMLELLEKKVKQGVDVRVMYDDFGCLFTLPSNYAKQLNARGIKACIFNRFVPVLSSRFNNRDHRKICVIDGNVGFTGGINL
ncbi:MAG: PLDc N-terminal domain-containing protein, partial [Oscillospiraceae bacterium]